MGPCQPHEVRSCFGVFQIDRDLPPPLRFLCDSGNDLFWIHKDESPLSTSLHAFLDGWGASQDVAQTFGFSRFLRSEICGSAYAKYGNQDGYCA